MTVCIVPLICAALVAISRTCDYHHFPSDVAVGSLLGFLTAYFCYRQYYPSFDDNTCDSPYPLNNVQNFVNETTTSNNIKKTSESESETTNLLDNDDKYT